MSADKSGVHGAVFRISVVNVSFPGHFALIVLFPTYPVLLSTSCGALALTNVHVHMKSRSTVRKALKSKSADILPRSRTECNGKMTQIREDSGGNGGRQWASRQKTSRPLSLSLSLCVSLSLSLFRASSTKFSRGLIFLNIYGSSRHNICKFIDKKKTYSNNDPKKKNFAERESSYFPEYLWIISS